MQLQLAFLVLLSPLSFHSCMLPLHGFPFLFILPSFYLSQLYIQVAIPSAHLSIIASLLAAQTSPPRMVWSLTPGRYRVDNPGLAAGGTDGALGRERKPELNQQGFPPCFNCELHLHQLGSDGSSPVENVFKQ